MSRKILYVFLLATLLSGCKNKDVNSGVSAKLRVSVPENMSVDNVGIEWKNLSTGVSYVTKTGKEGMAECKVEPGIYRVTAERRSVVEGENREEALVGSLEQVAVKKQGVDTSVMMSHSQYSRLVVKELYYAGCFSSDKGAYRNDNYLSLYNNSADTLWLDSIGIGIAAPVRALAPSPWLKDNPELPYLPIFRCGWLVPGSGREHPLAPGEDIVVAVNAIDHRKVMPNSVDLSHADWAFYRSDFNPEFSQISPGVDSLFLFWLNWTGELPPSYSIGPGAPGLVVYHMEMDAAEYAEEHLGYEPGKPQTSANQYMLIPKEWVLDYVECVESQAYAGYKRVPAALDKSAVWLSQGQWSGYSLHRRVAGTVNGRVIYQDTNDSANDFCERIPELAQ